VSLRLMTIVTTRIALVESGVKATHRATNGLIITVRPGRVVDAGCLQGTRSSTVLNWSTADSSPTLTRSASGDACRENANRFGPCDVEGQVDE